MTRDLYSNDVDTAAELAAFEELPADCERIADDFISLEYLRQRGYLDAVPIHEGDFLDGAGEDDAPF